jgi:hypothetical protein
MGGQANLFQKNVITLGYGERCHPTSTIWHKSFSKKQDVKLTCFRRIQLDSALENSAIPYCSSGGAVLMLSCMRNEDRNNKQQVAGMYCMSVNW